MNGTAHTIAGVGIGFVSSLYVQADLTDSLSLITLSTVASLAPDLDTQGKLTNRLAKPLKNMKIIALILGVLAGAYYFNSPDAGELVLLTSVFLILSSFLSAKISLTILCAGVITYGLQQNITWLSLAGAFVLIAIHLPHRSYTHSLVGLICFTYIIGVMENSFGITGFAATGFAAYAGHLICDSKHIPGNKRGVKILKPITNMEF